MKISTSHSKTLPEKFRNHPVMYTALTDCAYAILKRRAAEAQAQGDDYYIWFRGWGNFDGITAGTVENTTLLLTTLRDEITADKTAFIKKASTFKDARDDGQYKTPETSYADALEYLGFVIAWLETHKAKKNWRVELD